MTDFKKNWSSNSWIDRNLEKMMTQIMQDARHQRPMPTSITLHGIAYKKFIELLKSKGAYHPKAAGFDFVGVPVYINNDLPMGTFVVDRFRNVGLLK